MTFVLKQKKTSEIWQFFELIDDCYAKCNICKSKISYKTTISNLKKHMHTKHPTVALPESRKKNVSLFMCIRKFKSNKIYILL